MPEQTSSPEQEQEQTSAKRTSAKRTRKPASVTLAAQATATKAAKRKPVFRDVPNVPRVPLADGRVGCVQSELILTPEGVEFGPQMLTIPRKNADGSESGARFPLADIQLLADGFRTAGIQLV